MVFNISDRIARVAAYVLLFFNGTGAFYGGIHFITDPTGSSLGMDTAWLHTKLFSDYFYPGILLLIGNGIGSFVTFWFLYKKSKYGWPLLTLQGIILLVWISAQSFILQKFYPPMHIPFIVIGCFFIFSGYIIKTNHSSIKNLSP